MAKLFARQGARVVVADIDETAANRTADAIREDGGSVIARRLDVTDEAQTKAVTASVIDELGRIDVLVNNAGIAGVGDVEETSAELFDRVMAVNVRGVFLMSRAVVPHMIAAPRFGHQHARCWR